MSIKITGLDQLQRQLEEASQAFQSLDGEIAAVRFNPSDPASVEAAVAQVEEAIDAKIAPYRGNAMVESVAAQMKGKYREQLLQRAADGRLSSQSKIDMASPILNQIQNTLTDLQAADYDTYERHIKKLSRALHAPELDAITRKLTEGVDLKKWLDAGLSTRGQWVGSAELSWPADQEKELGLIVLLIDRFAEEPREALNFAFTFFHAGSRRPADDLQKMTRHVLVPFVRDYITHVRAQAPAEASTTKQTDVKPSEVLSLKPGIWGMSIDLKELGRRGRNWWSSRQKK